MFNGLKLKKLIELSNLTQKDFSLQSGISEQSLYGYFEPKGNPTAKALEKMANILQCSIDDFFDRSIETTGTSIGHHVNGNGNKVSGDITLSECRTEIEHLRALLGEKERIIAEKERTIQILMKK